jgi:thymidine phosphorylase
MVPLAACVEDLPRLSEIHRAAIIRELTTDTGGLVTGVDAGLIGQAVLQLGAGRATAGASIDFAVGMDQLVKCGETIAPGQVICRIHAQTEADYQMAAEILWRAVEFS